MSRPAPLRVSVVGPAHPYKGGAAQHTTELAHRLAAAGHRAVIESWSAQYPRLLYPGQLTVSEPELPLFQPTRRRLSWRRPDAWIREGRRIGAASDVVAFQLNSTTAQAVPYLGLIRGAHSAGARVVVIAHNVVPHEARRIDRSLGRLLYSRADLILVHGEQAAEEVAALARTPVAVVPLPPHVPGAHSGGTDDVVHDRLLFFGLVRPYKGVDNLLRALARARISAALTIAGEFWGGSGEIRGLVDTLGLAGRVTINEGYVDASDLDGLFAGCDALVLPYRSATGSQNALVGFSYGRPVIATATGTLADPVTDGVDGIVCAPDDVDALVGALERFYAPGEALRLRRNVHAPDTGPAWAAYLEALLRGAGSRAL